MCVKYRQKNLGEKRIRKTEKMVINTIQTSPTLVSCSILNHYATMYLVIARYIAYLSR